MTQYDEGCPVCGKQPGTPLEDGMFTTVSADAFCSVEHRREWHIRDGCDRCGQERPPSLDAPGWKIGGFTSYMDTEIVCPRCLVEWPKYAEYLEEIRAANLALQARIGPLQQIEFNLQYSLVPDHLFVGDDGIVALVAGFDEGLYMTLSEVEEVVAYMKRFDVAAYHAALAATKERQVALAAELKREFREPKPYQRWLAGER